MMRSARAPSRLTARAPRERIGSWALIATLALGGPASAEIVVEEITRERLEPVGLALSDWSYVADTAGTLAPPPADRAAWRRLDPRMASPDAVPRDWPGGGWFRLDLEVAPELAGASLALRLHRHHGASRIYLDDELVAEIGQWGETAERFSPALQPEPIALVISEPGRHRLLVRFANPDVRRYLRVGYIGGFSAWLGPSAVASARLAEQQQTHAGRRSLYAGVFLSFALLHLLLWAFRRESRENLYFALLSASLAALAFLLSHKAITTEPRIVFWSESAMNAAGVGFALFGVLFVHQAFRGRVSRRLLWLAAPLAAVLVWGLLQPAASQGAVFLVMLAGLLEMARSILLAVLRRQSGAVIVALGILAVVGGFGAGILALMGFLPRLSLLTFVAPFASVLLLTVSMSVYLARRVARTHRDLEAQLERVRRLSEEKLEQERLAGRELARRKLLEAEVEHKRKELEEARQLQLSMLPRTIPVHPRLEIAAHMSTATEVGGDYYDFELGADGALTIAVGDATGHGLRAGTMVTATKSLFNAFAAEPDLVATVSRSNAALKRMNLRSLNMALLLGRYEEGALRMAAAGMPFPLIHRRDGTLESVEISGMPLGSLRSFPYRAHEVDFAPGDTALLMSDGFPELLDPDDRVLGYERAAAIFVAAAGEPAQRIVERLVAAGEEWAGGREPEDDVTFVVLKAREPGQ